MYWNMNLQQKYNKIATRFASSKDRVVKRLHHWRDQGDRKMFEKYHSMYEEAEALRKHLGDVLVHKTLEHTGDTAAKVKRLKKLYNVLHQETKASWQQWAEAIVVALLLAGVIRNCVFSFYHVPTGSAESNILVGDRIWGNKSAYFFSEIKRGDLVIFDDPRDGYDESSKIQYLWQRYVGFPIPLLGLKSGPINVVKRAVAIPGDTIEGRIEEGKTVIYLNGKKLDEPYVNPLPLLLLYRDKGFFPFASVGPLSVPDFLHQEKKLVRYTYDPSKSYEDQPHYWMREKDIYKHPQTGQPVLFEAFSPTPSDHHGYSVDEFGPRTVPENMYWMMGDSRKNSEDSRFWHYLDKKYVHGRASFIIYSVDSEEALWLFDLIKHPIDFWRKHVRWNRFFKNLK